MGEPNTPLFRWSGRQGLELPQRAWEYSSERIIAGACEQEAESNKQDGEGKLHSALADIIAVRQMDQVNSADHDNHDADGPDALQSTEENRQAAGKLAQTHQIADYAGKV